MKLLLVVCAAAMLGGCRFWYKPVPVANAIGEQETVLAGDTVSVHREDRFEVYGPNAEAVYDGYEQMNRAYRAFERHFGAAARVAVILYADSVRPIDSASVRSFRERGFTLLRYARPRSARTRPRYGGLDYGGVLWPIAPTVARTLLARYADAQLEPNGERADTLLLDRFPLWYRAAVIHLVGEAGFPANDLQLVREKRSQWMPLQELLRLVRPSSADSLLDPSRRGEADEVTRLLAAQASTVGRFLVDREGPAVLALLGRGYVTGSSLAAMMAEFKSTPRTVQELDDRWRAWVDTRQN